MRKTIFAAMGVLATGVLAIGAPAAQATQPQEGGAEEHWAYSKCFDKALLRYVACPGLEDAPEPYFPPQAGPEPDRAPEPARREAGLYLGLKGGAAFAEDTDLTVNGAALDTGYETGFAIGALAGLDLGGVALGDVALGEAAPAFGLRTELEIGYMGLEADGHRLGGAALAGPDGDLGALYAFANLYGDLALLEDLDLVLGGGLGLGQVSFDGFSGGGATVMDDEAVAFGYHLDAGVAYAVAERWTAALSYRYAEFLVDDLAYAAPGVSAAGDPDVSAHLVLAEIRRRF